MKSRVLKRGIGLFFSVFVIAGAIANEGKLNVVASFSILGDMVKQVGGDEIQLTVLVGANQDAHVYRPTPLVAKQIQQADLVVLNGLGFEGWFFRLVQSSGYKGSVAIATLGIDALYGGHHHSVEDHEDHEDHDSFEARTINPHAWHSLPNALVYVSNIEKALSEAAPEKANYFHERAERYKADIMALDKQIKDELLAIGSQDLRVITTHDAYGYITKEYGIKFLSPQGLTTDAEPSAKDVAALIRQVKQENVNAIFVENITDNRLIEQIARETGIHMSGELYSDALTDESGEAPTYLDMMRVNLSKLVAALK